MTKPRNTSHVLRPARRDDFFCQPPLHVVLVEPEIPPNTGNVIRMCYATGSVLHLIKPLGFQIDDKRLRRAGLDYWQHVDINVHDSLDEVVGKIIPRERCFFLSTRATKPIWEIPIQPGDALIFGKESTGLGPELIEEHRERLFHIPILPDTVRSINLSNAVAITLFDSYRRLAPVLKAK